MSQVNFTIMSKTELLFDCLSYANHRADNMVSLPRAVHQQVHLNAAVYGGHPDLPVHHVHLQQLCDMTCLPATVHLDHLVLVVPDQPHQGGPQHTHPHHCSHHHSRHHSHLMFGVYYGGAEL